MFFKELTVKADAKRNEVFYTFCFIESGSHKRCELAPDFAIAQEGENLFDIAYRCKIPIERIMKLNEFKNPFDVSAGSKVVLR